MPITCINGPISDPETLLSQVGLPNNGSPLQARDDGIDSGRDERPKAPIIRHRRRIPVQI
jgi:hypothetical protein